MRNTYENPTWPLRATHLYNMADTARDEADRFFSSRDHPASHPEDRDNLADHSEEEDEKPNRPSTYGSDSDDDDNTHKMATMTQARTSYHIPSTSHYANTGPKGVIADAQSFARAKKSTFRTRLADMRNNLSSRSERSNTSEKENKPTLKHTSSDSDVGLIDEEDDSEFINTWRQTRIQELQQKSAHGTRRISPSRRTWGVLLEVDANGYLDAIEKVSNEDIVVVLVYDSDSRHSRQVEDELGMLAYKYSTTRFVKLHQDIAEMESVEVPAVLAYRAGDVFTTISGAKAEGLEDVLKKQRVLPS